MTTTQYAMAGAFDGFSFDNEIGPGVTGSNNFSTPADAPTSSAGGGFWDMNFTGLLSTVGATAAQLIAASKGQQVIVKDSSGATRDIAPELMQKLEQQAQANQTSVDSMMKMMQMQMMQAQQEKNKPKKDNTALYVGGGVAALVLLGGILYITQSKKKK